MKVREIVFSPFEPRRDALWIGRVADGSYFAKVWDSGWKTIALADSSSGSGSVSLDEVNELIEKSEEAMKTYISDEHEEIKEDEVVQIWEKFEND